MAVKRNGGILFLFFSDRSLGEYQGNILLVGINYDVKTKEHTCIIEKHVSER